MNKLIELVQKISKEVCKDCGWDSDCGITPKDCLRITKAMALIGEYLEKMPKVEKKFDPKDENLIFGPL